MAKPEWGTKRFCKKCGDRFYDLENLPILCPTCDAEYVLANQVEETVAAEESEDDAIVTLDSEDKVENETAAADDSTLLDEDADDDVDVVIDADLTSDNDDSAA